MSNRRMVTRHGRTFAVVDDDFELPRRRSGAARQRVSDSHC